MSLHVMNEVVESLSMWRSRLGAAPGALVLQRVSPWEETQNEMRSWMMAALERRRSMSESGMVVVRESRIVVPIERTASSQALGVAEMKPGSESAMSLPTDAWGASMSADRKGCGGGR